MEDSSYSVTRYEFGSLTFSSQGRAIITFETMRGFAWPAIEKTDLLSPLRMSRFAFIRRDGDRLLAESPLSSIRAILHDQLALNIFARLVQPVAADQLAIECVSLGKQGTSELCSLLLAAGFVGKCDQTGTLGEERDHALTQWEFHDLLFHSRSRLGTHDHPLGAVYPYLGTIAPPPAIAPSTGGKRIALHRPDLNEATSREGTLSWAIERRKSIREYDRRPISVRELGEFLYRTARVREISILKPSVSVHYETSSRPYPSGGAAYDLEVYLIIVDCLGMHPGVFHYEPLDHELAEVCPYDGMVRNLVLGARLSAGLTVDPPVVIVLASRFQRLSWKYRGIAYAMTLKNVGILFQTMYLVATDMNLAPCALGVGDSLCFAEVVGINRFQEGSVGEFALGVAAQQR